MFSWVNQISMGHVQCQTFSLPEGKNGRGGDPNTLWTSLTGAITYQQGYIAISQAMVKKLPSKMAPTVLRWLYCGYDESVNRGSDFRGGNCVLALQNDKLNVENHQRGCFEHLNFWTDTHLADVGCIMRN